MSHSFVVLYSVYLYKYNSPLNISEAYRQVVDVVSYDPEIGSSRFTIDTAPLRVTKRNSKQQIKHIM